MLAIHIFISNILGLLFQATIISVHFTEYSLEFTTYRMSVIRPDLKRAMNSRGGNTFRQTFNRQKWHLEPFFRLQLPTTASTPFNSRITTTVPITLHPRETQLSNSVKTGYIMNTEQITVHHGSDDTVWPTGLINEKPGFSDQLGNKNP